MGVLGSERGLCRLVLPRPSEEEACRELGAEQAVRSPDFFADLAARLQAYLEGKPAAFPDKLDLSKATEFQHRVWQATRQIGYGETRSYRWVAERLGSPPAARAVGQALGRNPLPIIIPCHRVIASDGGLGGYRDGLELKRELLRLEGGLSRLSE